MLELLHESELVKESIIKPQNSCFWTKASVSQRAALYLVLWSVRTVLSQGRGGWSQVLEGRAIGFATGIAPTCCDLGKPLCPHHHYFFYHPHEGVNCFTVPRAALLVSSLSGFIHSATGNTGFHWCLCQCSGRRDPATNWATRRGVGCAAISCRVKEILTFCSPSKAREHQGKNKTWTKHEFKSLLNRL